MTYSFTESETFTKTQAEYLASKIATDLKRIQRLYGEPADFLISQYYAEAVILLKSGFLKCITYGFKRNGEWIEPTLRYTAYDLANDNGKDDDPGKVRAGKNVSGARFSSVVEYNDSWNKLSSEEQDKFESQLPVQRTVGITSSFNGYLSRDLTYSSGGQSIYRESLRSF